MKVHGVSLHYFDSEQNHDKFYRAFIFQSDDSGRWAAVYHWGRDGAPNGQAKKEIHATYWDAKEATEKQISSKIRKGYEFLGQGEIEVPDLTDVHRVGAVLHARVGRKPTKLHSGFSLIITEEDDIMDLIGQ